MLPNAAGEGVERRTVDDADIGGRQAGRDCQRLDDAAEPRLVLIVDEAEIRPAANGADVPRHLHGEQHGADDGDDRHPTDEISGPSVERRMLGIEHGERHQKPQHGEQVKRRDEAREQRERTRVIAADVPVEPVHPHGAATHIRTNVNRSRALLEVALEVSQCGCRFVDDNCGDPEQLNATLNQLCAYLPQIVLQGACHG